MGQRRHGEARLEQSVVEASWSEGYPLGFRKHLYTSFCIQQHTVQGTIVLVILGLYPNLAFLSGQLYPSSYS